METKRFRTCTPRYLPRSKWAQAAAASFKVNPDNRPPNLTEDAPGAGDRLALDLERYWGKGGVKLTVGFIDTPDNALRARILTHMNAWGLTANVTFIFSATDPQVRVARRTEEESPGNGGYWSYIGTDILTTDADEPTLNLEAFTMDVSEDEFHRVIRHEAGHTLGFPHEHMRADIIKRLDRDKVITDFMRTQSWSKQEVIDQVLTPLEESSLLGTPADETSIMCYQIDGDLTLDGKEVVGGLDINASDAAFAAKVYPKPA
jgi:hypothetical protein